LSAVRLEHVTLWRSLQEESSFDLKRRLFALLRGRQHAPRRRRVLDDVTLDLEPGEKLGIVGPNGSGKSTLLKVICGILTPSSGSAHSLGAIAPLIELGAGFDPELPVVDNIQLYGILLGHSAAEMRAKTPGILEFAELEEYAAVPVRALSSGMVARLGFSIATDTNPDILILDEVLSVGDESFRNRSRQRIESMWHDHVTVLLVSHDLQFIRESCTRAIWMDAGAVRYDGPAGATVDAYLRAVDSSALTLLAKARARLGQ
jgi:ABC-type polysaccharide/polyol phosphate transport system ATPase subunit